MRASRFAIDVAHVSDDAIAGAVRLARGLLAKRQDPLGLAEVDNDVVALLETPNDAADELTLAVLVFVEDQVALGVAHPLQQHLLRGLRSDATEGASRLLQLEKVTELLVLRPRLFGIFRPPEHLKAELFAELRLEAPPLGVFESDFALGLAHFFDDRHILKEVDLTGLVAETRFQLARRPERALGSLQNGGLDGVDEDLFVDPFFFGDLFEDEAEVGLSSGRDGLRCHEGASQCLFCLPSLGRPALG